MKRLLLGASVMVLLALAAEKANRAELQLEAAVNKEVVAGDLKGAIELYRKAAQSSDRAVAAKALLRLGACYEKQGDAEARKAYERLVKEFADQKEQARDAQARLAALGAGAAGKNAGLRLRQIWDNAANLSGRITRDGRFLTFVDRKTGDLAIRDLTAGVDRHITEYGGSAKSGGGVEASVISPDGRWVAFLWWNRVNDGFGYQMRVIGTDGKGERILIPRMDHLYIHPYAVSPDGKWIAANSNYQREDTVPTAVTLISVEDGRTRDLVTSMSRPAWGMSFSPDGKWLAYTAGPSSGGAQPDLFILPVSGGQVSESVLMSHPANDRMVGWTPDGGAVLFLSDRGGSSDLYQLPVKNGVAAGEPRMLRAMPREGIRPLGMTDQGALVYGATQSTSDAVTAQLDPASGKLLSEPVALSSNWVGGTGSVSWAPDGQKLKYWLSRDQWVIRSKDGRERRLLSPLAEIRETIWSADGQSWLCSGVGKDGKHGIYRVDPVTGADDEVFLMEGKWSPPVLALSPDGNTLYYGVGSRPRVVARDLRTGVERVVYEKPGDGGVGSLALSADGRKLAIQREQDAVRIVDTVTGAASDVVHPPIGNGNRPGRLAWSPDGRSLFLLAGGGKSTELWKLPAEGGEPVRHALNGYYSKLSVSPDGKQVGMNRTQSHSEVWILENFLPKAAK